jgi:FkbM family methyltransferase
MSLIGALKGGFRRMGLIDRTGVRAFLRDVSGVIHVGANMGQERALYAQYRLPVLWVEPLEEAFALLQRNIAGYPGQRALKALLTDEDGREYQFHVASNAGQSSSIFELALHKEVWPDVSYTQTITVVSRTLTTLLAENGVDPSRYDALVMDTQGSELLILRGAAELLRHFKYVQVEVADFEAYLGCCQVADVESYLAAHGYRELVRKAGGRHANGGRYFDIVYEREPA